jgi:hypothetical protein
MKVNMGKLVRTLLSTSAIVMLLSACGGGSGDGATSLTADPTGFSQGSGSVASTSTIVVTGAATKGPIRAATVSVYAINDFGFAQGAVLATAITDDTGNFSVNLPAGTGLVLVETRGGSFIDESDQEPDVTLKRQLSLSDTQGFVSILPAGATTVAITPFTQALVEKARLDAQTGGFETSFSTSANAFNTIIGFNVLTTIPANPLQSAAANSASEGQYALLLGGVANVINNMSIQLNFAQPTFEIISAVIRDLTDGNIDGRRFSSPVTLPSTGAALPTNVSFESEMGRFKNNNFTNFATVTQPVIAAPVVANTPPVANAGIDFAVTQSALATLNGAASFDPDGAILTYDWVQLGGTSVVLSSRTVAAPTFTAPLAAGATSGLQFQLTVTDAAGVAAIDAVVVTVSPPPNNPPVSNAGLDFSVTELTIATLSGAASTDPDAQTLIYAWTQISGAPVSLSSSGVVAPTFLAPSAAVAAAGLQFRLAVTDPAGATATDTVLVSVTTTPNTPPVANAGADIVAAQNALVTLSGAASTDAEGQDLSYSWLQVSGSPVTLSSAAAVAPTFTSSVSILRAQNLQFQLSVTDPAGAVATDTVEVSITPAINSVQVYTVSELALPFQFGRDLESGALAAFNPDGTGQLTDESTQTSFNYSVSGIVLTIDFSATGGLVEALFTSFSAPAASGAQDELSISEVVDRYVLTLTEDGVGVDLFSLQTLGTRSIFNVTQDVALTPETIDDTETIKLYDFTARLPFSIVAGQKRSLLTNISTQVATLSNAPALALDSLTFALNGTGFAAEKGVAFDWVQAADGLLTVTFSDTEVASYSLLESRPSGDIVAVQYTYANGDQRVGSELSFIDDSAVVWSADSLAGLYTSRGSFELDSGTVIADDLVYRLAPDNTGLVEFETIDSVSGEKTPAIASLGICWTVNGAGELVMNRVNARNNLFQGSKQPNAATCATLTDDLVVIRRESALFDQPGVNLRTVVRQADTTCSGTSPLTGCGPVVTGYFPRLLEKTFSFTGNPPLAIDAVTTSLEGGVATFNAFASTQDSDGAVDPASVQIVKAPIGGTLSTDATTGVITYTPTSAATTDTYYYKINDAEGNPSNVGRVDVLVNPPVPVVVASTTSPLQGELVELDASASTDNGSIDSYQWFQVSGTSVTLNNATTALASFSAPAYELLQGGALEFQLQLRDNAGLTSFVNVDVQVEPVLVQEFIAVEELTLPLEDGINLGESFAVKLVSATTGTLSNDQDTYSFAWSVVDTDLRLDFSAIGGLPASRITVFEDLNADGVQEQVTVEDLITSYDFSVLTDGLKKDVVLMSTTGVQNRFDVTNSAALTSTAFSNSRSLNLYDSARTSAFTIDQGETLSLEVDNTAAIVGLTGLAELRIDALTFEAGGVGSADNMAETFFWQISLSGRLQVVFESGDIANYSLLAESEAGNLVAVEYVFADARTVVSTQRAFSQDSNVGWDAVIFSNNAGIYTLESSVRLNDGSDVLREDYYRILPDGTGTFEGNDIDPATGQTNAWFTSTFGICASVDADGDLLIRRTRAPDDRYPGSLTPSVSTCMALTNPLTGFQFNWRLFDITAAGDHLITDTFGTNECGLFPLVSPSPAGCDSTKVTTTSFSSRIAQKTLFLGAPPFAVGDDISISADTSSVPLNVLTNDLDGDTPIDPTSVEILVSPTGGSAVVDSVTGEINYLAIEGTVTDSITYRVKDSNGNLSTAASVSISIGAPLAVVNTSNLTPQQSSLIALDGSGSVDNTGIVSYVWTQIGGELVGIVGSTTANAEFTAPLTLGPLLFRLTVTDSDGFTSFEDTAITVVGIAPVAVATASNANPLQGEVVTLDASGSTDNGAIVSYQWSQLSGSTVVLNNATTTSADFIAPDYTLVEGGPLEFQLLVTDNDGLSSSINLALQVEPVLAQEFIAVEEFVLPSGNDGINLGESFAIALSAPTTGTLSNDRDTYGFEWSLVSSETVLRLDFSEFGGLPGFSSTQFEDLNADGVLEEVTTSEIYSSYDISVLTDGSKKDAVVLEATGSSNRFDETNSVLLSSEAFSETTFLNLYDAAQILVFAINPSETLSLEVDNSAALTDFVDPAELRIDALTFDADNTGTADHKAETFTWQTLPLGELQVAFVNGEVANYSLLAESDAGDLVSVEYLFTDGRVVVSTQLAFTENPAVNWDAATFSNNAGIYTIADSVGLDNGTDVPNNGFYRILPDGTGSFEVGSIDAATGLAEDWFSSSFGICASVDGDGDLLIRRVRARDDRYVGSTTPSVATCSALTDASVSFQFKWRLFDISPAGEYLFTDDYKANNCGLLPITSPEPVGCDPTLSSTNFFPRVASKTAFIGTPPFAVGDSIDVPISESVFSLDVLVNDLAGDVALDPTTVEILVAPTSGTATVDAVTGAINYTADAGATYDSIIYRVKDIIGNVSTFARVDLVVGIPNAIAAVSNLTRL